MIDYFVVEPCVSSNGIEIKLKDRKIDLKKAQPAFSKLGEVVASSSVVLLVKINGYSLSVYGSGRMMVKGVKRTETKKIEKLAISMLRALEKEGAII
ncbi:hypothetical protein HZC07_03105 [Candidatus Micrarchaeota archaeon]|nr:hypothetical protein [Candidatus Micrarchaeota archaeon]